MLLGDLALTGSVLDPRVLMFTAAVSLLVGVFTGLIPALQASRTQVFSMNTAIGGRGGARRSRAQSALLAMQAALSLVALVGAGLFGRSLLAINALRMGVDVDRVLVGSMNLRSIGRRATETDAVFTRALERVAGDARRHRGGDQRDDSVRSVVRHRDRRHGAGLGAPLLDDVQRRHAELFPDARRAGARGPRFFQRRRRARAARRHHQQDARDARMGA